MRVFNPKTVVSLLRYEKAERTGFLLKKRSETKGAFKKRYFIACGNILSYFEKKTDKEPLGFIILEGHIVEMLDDRTLVIRFPSFVESSRCCVLRSDTASDMELWMRVLTRSGIDFFNLTLEDLEDQMNALSVIRNSQSPDQLDLPLLIRQNQEAVSCSNAGRPNPFNPTDPRAPVPRTPPQAPLSSTTNPNGEHLAWLFKHDWGQLHAIASSWYKLPSNRQ